MTNLITNEVKDDDKIQIFLATHNRPDLVLNSIESILNQTYSSFELIISDNSTNDNTQSLIYNTYGNKIKYYRRVPSVTPIEHLNLILKDVSGDYFMIFHDDDVMHKNMLETLYFKIVRRKSIIAVGANARVIENGHLTNKRYYPKLKVDISITEKEEIVLAYLKTGIVPFPSYLYRSEVAKRLRFNINNGGNFCDAAFIFDLLSLGSIIFSADPLMDYSKRKNQVDQNFAFMYRIKLLRYFSKMSEFKRNSPLINNNRILNLYAELKYSLFNKRILLFSKRYNNIAKLLIKSSPLNYFPRVVILSLFSIIIRK